MFDGEGFELFLNQRLSSPPTRLGINQSQYAVYLEESGLFFKFVLHKYKAM